MRSIVLYLLAGDFGAMIGTCQASAVLQEAVAKHAQTVSKIKSIHIKIESHGSIDGGETKLTSSFETWRSGNRERVMSHAFRRPSPRAGGGWEEIDQTTSARSIQGFSETEVRLLRNWDPENPRPGPLVDAWECSPLVICSITPRDALGAASHTWSSLMLELALGVPLAQAVKTGDVELLPTDSADLVRLKLVGCDPPWLSGSIVDLDAKHGYLIRRLEFPSGIAKEVSRFQCYPDGIWLPEKVEINAGDGALRTTSTVTDCQVNIPISDADLDVEFPAGARVDEAHKGMIHLWGNGKPAQSFMNEEDFLAAVEAKFPSRWLRMVKAALGAVTLLIGITLFAIAYRSRIQKWRHATAS